MSSVGFLLVSRITLSTFSHSPCFSSHRKLSRICSLMVTFFRFLQNESTSFARRTSGSAALYTLYISGGRACVWQTWIRRYLHPLEPAWLASIQPFPSRIHRARIERNHSRHSAPVSRQRDHCSYSRCRTPLPSEHQYLQHTTTLSCALLLRLCCKRTRQPMLLPGV
jgi:hypothetical protein